MACSQNHGTPDESTPSTLPPPCYHRRPQRFCCPKFGCPPPEPCPPIPRCSSPCLPFTCRSPPRPPPPPPTICIARPCPEPPGRKPFCCPPPPKAVPPPTCVRFCIRYSHEGSTYCPCYSPGTPTCSSA